MDVSRDFMRFEQVENALEAEAAAKQRQQQRQQERQQHYHQHRQLLVAAAGCYFRYKLHFLTI